MNEEAVKKEMDILLSMIQKCATLKSDNYKERVTEYRQKLFDQALKVNKLMRNSHNKRGKEK